MLLEFQKNCDVIHKQVSSISWQFNRIWNTDNIKSYLLFIVVIISYTCPTPLVLNHIYFYIIDQSNYAFPLYIHLCSCYFIVIDVRICSNATSLYQIHGDGCTFVNIVSVPKILEFHNFILIPFEFSIEKCYVLFLSILGSKNVG